MPRWLRLLLWALGAIVLVLVAAHVYIFHLGGLERIVNGQIARYLEEPYGVSAHVGRISGSLYSDITVEDIVVSYRADGHDYTLLRLARLSAAYKLRDLVNNKWQFDYLVLDSAAVTITQNSEQGWILPGSDPGSDKQKKSGPEFGVSALTLNDCSIRIQRLDDTVSVDHLHSRLALLAIDDTFSLNLERLRFDLGGERLSLDAAGGKATFANNSLLVSDLALSSDRTRIRLSGMAGVKDGLKGQVDFAIDNLDVAQVAEYFGAKLHGNVDLNGSVTFGDGAIYGEADLGGRFMMVSLENLHGGFHFEDRILELDTLYGTILGACGVDGAGLVDFGARPERYQLRADIRNFNLRALVPHSFDSDLSGHIDLAGESFQNKDLRLNVATELFESSFADYPLQSAAGTIIVTTDSIFFADSFLVTYYENSFCVGGAVGYSDSMHLEISADLANLDRYRGKLFIDQPGGRARAEATLSGLTGDPDLDGVLVSDSIWIYGLYADSIWSEFQLKEFLTGRRGQVQVRAFGGEAWSLPVDSLQADLAIDSNVIVIEDFAFANQHADLRGCADYQYSASTVVLSIDSFWVTAFGSRFRNRGEMSVTIDSAGFLLDQVILGNEISQLNVSGRVNYDETMDLLLNVSQVPIGPWVRLFETPRDIEGLVSADAHVQGGLLRPVVVVDGSIDSLRYQGLVLGDLSAGLAYADQQLRVDSIQVLSRGGRYRAEGFLAVDLALTRSEAIERFPNSPMDIDITAEDTRFDLVSVILPSVEQLDGDFSASFRLSGSPNDPHLEGGATIKNGRLKYFDIVQPIFTDSAGVTMENDRIKINRIAAYVLDKDKKNRKRYAFAGGEIVVQTLDSLYYDIDVEIPEGLPFTYELDDIQGRVKGYAHIKGASPPTVSGDLELIDMKYRVNFAGPETGSPLMAALLGESTWDLDVNVHIPNSYWIQNDDINAEFAGDLNLKRHSGEYQFIGEMEIMRGRGFLFDKTFRLEPEGRVIFGEEEGLNAHLDIIGRTRVAAVSADPLASGTDVPEQLEVGIHVTGTVEVPEINPTDDTEMSTEELLFLLVANQYQDGTVSASGRVENRIYDMVGSQISQIGARRLGLETFEIDPYYYGGELDPLNTRVTVGFYTAPNLYVYGRSALSLQSGQEVGFEYRFNRNWLLEGKGDEEQRYRLSLKLHWEF
ncbi:MAG: translocation/assembly module TamB domain-containing protein [bacterium]